MMPLNRRDFVKLGALFEVIRLREFRFDQVEAVGTRFLGWSCLLRRKGFDDAGVTDPVEYA